MSNRLNMRRPRAWRVSRGEIERSPYVPLPRHRRQRFVANVVFVVCVAGLIGIGLTLALVGVANGAVW